MMERRCVVTPDRNAITQDKGHDPLSNRIEKRAMLAPHCHQQQKLQYAPGIHNHVSFSFSRPCSGSGSFSFSFFGCVPPPLLIDPSHFSPPPPPPCPQTSSDGYKQLAPTTNDEYSADKEPYASNDVDVSRQLVGRENLRAQKARPRALVRVYERAARELCRGVICGSGVGRRGAFCHCSWPF